MIEPLSGLDAVFLDAETSSTPMNVIATILVDGSVEFEAIVARIESRLPSLPFMRRRLVEMPFGLDRPAWIEDPDFAVREHVTRVSACAPGDERALEDVVARFARGRLDRARPLWELVVVDGLANDRTAVVIKAHHAALDGVSGTALLLHLFDRPGEAPGLDDRAGLGERPPSEPSASELFRHGLTRLQEHPRRGLDAAVRAGRSASRLARAWLDRDPGLRDAALPFQAASSPFDGPLSARRSVAYARVPFDSVRCIRGAFGGTFNDVVLAACTRALQAELRDRGAGTDAPLLAAVPVSTRGVGDAAASGNRISAFVVQLPVQLEDPIHQLADVRRGAFRAKRFHAALGDEALTSLAEVATPGVTRWAFETYTRWKLASLHRPLVNLVVSNVPGPPVGLELFGRPVESLHPHGPLMEGVGLNITILSYAGSLGIGVLACRERMSEAHRLADGLASAFEELAKLAERAMPHMPPMAWQVA